MIRLRSEASQGVALSAPATVYVGLLVAAPLGILVVYSFWTQTYVSIDRTFTWENYRFALEDPLVRHLLVRSVWIAGLVTAATVALAYPIAYFIAFRTQHKTLWLLLITIPFWTSYLLRVFSWKLILGFNGVLNSALMTVGLIDEPLTFLLYNEIAVVLTLAHAWAPFAIMPIYVSLQKIDRSLLEAATDLGCSRLERFLRVTLPLTVPGIIAACLIIFIPTVGDYVTPALVGGSDGKMIANLIQVQFGAANNWPLGATLSLMAMVSVGLVAGGFVVLSNLMARRIR
ncbi:ABC transporter permease [Roseovarius indicus]|uniref:Spermidine/putrescine ABC transporter n=1 Tax=Roseovarius indicus TaxID=540747 RepID=A0A0T5P249_9RHOB|nr:ABC transporter permease [Roseovarius indicus]KRS15224.1 spermidine/putrescine ABC transporter [Roseovarius indicus]OAO08826.1 spermidine/putrescine ABC transporter [Roseovarius indicus]QEW24874.1 Spermidine/putrescine transport system permease protein PotB [Roseovarius indicus]SFE49623.1 spermidine/putrescine transport system permease protein [Roseovarius indicus]